MEYLKRLFDRPSPEHLYHYTNANSFLGIIQKTEMWASHIRFMNDLKEEVYALELLERRLPDLLKTTLLNPNKMIKLIQKYFDEENSKLGIFVLSFSENSDDLNQWRGYANGTPSYCIKFNSSISLSSFAVSNFFCKFSLVKLGLYDFSYTIIILHSFSSSDILCFINGL